jgi:hypothetical protein
MTRSVSQASRRNAWTPRRLCKVYSSAKVGSWVYRPNGLVKLDEWQILCIWTPWFTYVRPLAFLFFDALDSFCVFMFCRSISEEWKNSCGIAWKIWKFWRTRSIELKIDRLNFARSRSIDFWNFSELTFAEARQNTQSGASPWQKAVLHLIFTAEHAGCMTLVVSSKRGLEWVKWVILHEFLALISFYKSHSHTSLLREFREQ